MKGVHGRCFETEVSLSHDPSKNLAKIRSCAMFLLSLNKMSAILRRLVPNLLHLQGAFLTVIPVNNNTGISSTESVTNGIKWGHSVAGIVRPVQPKEPLSVDTVCRIADYYISSCYSFSFHSLGWLPWVLPYGRNS